MGPWIIALVGVLIIAAGLAIPIKGPGGISNSQDGGPAPRRSVPAIVAGFVIVAVGLIFTWQPWSSNDSHPTVTAKAAENTGVAPADESLSSSSPSHTPTPWPTPSNTSNDSKTPTPPATTSNDTASTPAPPPAKPWIQNKDFTIAPPDPIGKNSQLDLSKPASGINLDPDISALVYGNGKTLALGTNGVVFGYAPTQPTSADDCVSQAQSNAITELAVFLAPDRSYIKPSDAFCVSDKAGYVAWLHFLDTTPKDTYQPSSLHFKITIWKPAG